MSQRPTEARHPLSPGLHALPPAEAAARLVEGQRAALAAVQGAIPALAAAAGAAADALTGGGRMAYAGAGSSGLMALADALELAGTFGIAPARTPVLFAGGIASLARLAGGVEDDEADAHAAVAAAGIAAGDALIAVAASGATPWTLAAARAAQTAGARVIGLANAPGAPLLALADHPVCLDTGPEVITGSTRMAAGTAQKIALNVLSVLVGIRIGAVHDGYMVDVWPENAKLAARARGIVAALAGVDTAAAAAAMAAAGAVKPAVLVARGHTPEAAQAALARAGGHLAAALADG